MFEARPNDTSLMKKIIASVKELVSEVNLDFTESGISLQALDSAHVALVSMLLFKEGFEPYRCDRGLTLGVNLSSLNRILSCAESDDIITFTCDDTADFMNLKFESKDGNKVSEYQLRLMDIDQEHLAIPEQQYPCVVSLPSNEFSKICRDNSNFVQIIVTKGGIKFSTTGETTKGNVTLKSTDSEIISLNVKKPVENEFSLKHLLQFAKSQALSDHVTLHLAIDLPIMVEYNFEAAGYVKYFLAPKLSDVGNGEEHEEDED
ncbi:3750_t:CDS:2 [Ambispora leptoticha]|uniref:DNA sliding clamp PCNA n=1 Tax=Ambispora leptoticha TaxID=144679 RepID=A0A9N9AZE5_9GLOM|nr:3750_t:CDS:2 [Ambispora leptoticha]